MDNWIIRAITTPTFTWGAVRGHRTHQCPKCGLLLLTGETPGFCCGTNGKYALAVPRLPPLPPEFNVLVNDPRISSQSRVLNLIFSFASLESTHEFPTFPAFLPSFVAVKGKVYHRVRPSHTNSAVRWLLNDGFLPNAAPHLHWASSLPPQWISCVQTALQRVNPMVPVLQHMGQLSPQLCADVSLTIFGSDTSPEIAAIMNYESTTRGQVRSRNLIVIHKGDEGTIPIPTTSKLWEPLAYPLIFPHGTLGWGLTDSSLDTPSLPHPPDRDSETTTTQMWHYRRLILQEDRFRIFGRLMNEYIVDMFSRDLECRLNYIRANQLRIRENDAELMGEEHVSERENVYLPSSFLGSDRWARSQIADSLAIAATYGGPTYFITFTCSPDWPEIQSQLRPGQNYSDIPIVVCRVFKRKLAWLLQTLKKMFPNSGGVVYMIHSVEFQKRGLPHAHILVKYLKGELSPSDIDNVVSAELPDDPDDRALVQQFMVHSHGAYCRRTNKNGQEYCRFNYPAPMQPETCIQPDGRVSYRRRRECDRFIVPHCLALLRKLKCHLNFEVASSSHIFQYLFKYIHKGPDNAHYRLHLNDAEAVVDEIEEYWKGRYLVATEATWRTLGFHVCMKEPACTELPIHLPDSTHFHQYHRRNGQQSTLSLLDRYFCRPLGSYVKPETGDLQWSFADLTFLDYFRLFRLEKFNLSNVGRPRYYIERTNHAGSQPNMVILRTTSHVPRIIAVQPSKGELFYLRALLGHKPASSFEDLRTVNGTLHLTFQLAATALGLFSDKREAELAMNEAVQSLYTPHQLRILFVHLLVNDCVTSAINMWTTYSAWLGYDHYLRYSGSDILSTELTLRELGRLLEEYGLSLQHFGLPNPSAFTGELEHELARWSAMAHELALEAHTDIERFLPEQRYIYDAVMHAIITRQTLLCFVDGKAGRGKTTLIRAICNKLRSLHHVVLATATSAFAAQQYPGGRTTHSTFKVPVNENNEFLVSPISPDQPRAELIRSASCIIWDEAPMANQAVFSCVNETCQTVMSTDAPFGGKVMILLGDFRQTCPVIRGGTRVRVVHASIRSSPLWGLFTIFRLTTPIRNAEDPEFADFVDSIGEGAGPSLSLPYLDKVYTEADLTSFVYPDSTLAEPIMCLKRAILAPTNDQVDRYNDLIISRLPGDQRMYFAADSLKEVEEVGLTPPDAVLDWATRTRQPGLPPHSLMVKVGGVYRLLRNLSIDRGLVKNIRVVIIAVGNRLITVRVLRDINGGSRIDNDDVLIPRITFSITLPSHHTLLRRQFPLAPAYATTFNSCQGLTLDVVGVDLTRPVFSHGQLYTALSRVRHRSHARVRLLAGQEQVMNVTYPEILL